MARLSVQLSPSAQAVLARLRDPSALGHSLCPVLDLQNELTIGHLQKDYLSERGPTTLGVITNRLRSSVVRTDATFTANRLAGGIGTNVRYAAAHEFGVDKDVSIPQHIRKRPPFYFRRGDTVISRMTALRAGLLTRGQVSRKTRESGRYVFAAKKKLKEIVHGGPITVRAYTYHMRLPARAPFQHALQDRLPDYSEALSRTILNYWSTTA